MNPAMSGRACILLSTYNGSRFLDEQLESLRAQLDCQLDLRVRDDGSRDDTLAILRRHADSREGMNVVAGENLGVTRSFHALLEGAPEGYGAYFYCDQDDVWDPRKVGYALQALAARPADVPALYFSRLRYVSEAGGTLGYSRVPRHVGLGNALVESVAIGCTIAMNDAARRLICTRLPAVAIMHDWWSYLVVSAFGSVIYDPRATIDYRQHQGNTVGAKQDRFFVRLARRVRRRPDTVTRWAQADECLRLFGDSLPPQSHELMELFVGGKRSWRRRVDLLRRRGVRRSTWTDQMWLNVQLALNDY